MADKYLGTLRVDLAAFTAGFDRNLDKAAGKLYRFGRRTERQLKSAGKNLTASVTLPIVAAGTASVVASDKIATSSRRIQVATGATQEQMESLNRTMLAIAKETPDGFDAISAAMGSLQTQTGETGDSLERVTRVVLAGSRLLEEDSAAAAQGVGRLIKQFDLSADAGAEVYARLFENAQKYDVAVDKQIENLRTFGPVLTNANINLSEQADLMARLESAGIDVSRVMPGINQAVRRFAEGGLDARDALTVSINAIRDAKTETEALSLATKLFGSEGAARLTRAVLDGVVSMDQLGKSSDLTAAKILEFEKDSRTGGERLRRLWNRVSIALAPVGDKIIGILVRLEPAMMRALDVADDAAAAFSGLSPRVQVASLALVGLTAAIGPMLLALGFAIGGIRSIGLLALNSTRFIVGLSAAMLKKLVPAATAATRALLPLAGVIGGIVVAAAGGFALGTYLAEEVEAFEVFGLNVVTAADTLWIEVQRVWYEGVSELKKITIQGLVGVLDGVVDFGPMIANKIAGVIDNVSPSIANKVRGMAAAAGALGGVLTGQLGVGVDEIEADLKAKTDKLDEQLDLVAQVLESRLAEIESKYDDPNRVAGEAFRDRLESYIAPIRDFLSGTSGLEGGGDIESKLDAIDSAASKLLDSAAGKIPEVADAANALGLTIDDILGKAGGKEADKAIQKADEWKDRMLDAVEGWSRGVSSTFADILIDGEATFDQLAESFARMLVQMLTQELIFAPIFAAIRGSLGLTTQAHGGVWSKGAQVTAYADGGVVSRPTLFPTSTAGHFGLMGEAGPEAILPLARGAGGELGVRSSGGGVTVNVIDQRSSGEAVSVSESRGPGGSRQIEILIRDTVRGMIGSGELDRAMGGAYGVRRTGVSR